VKKNLGENFETLGKQYGIITVPVEGQTSFKTFRKHPVFPCWDLQSYVLSMAGSYEV
jgi:hypothetical protein